jgi:asparagine synthase (glutamine-hydrolysing)
MCGIAGIIAESPSRETVERMVNCLRHRGPDDSGVWEGPGVCVGHTRLSILDLSSAGHQPMTKGHLTVVYNGEIYNFRDLRGDLPGPFASETDTEVLLHLYERDGAAMVHKLRGMFAFSIWDARERRLFAARDRLGIKPFFYRELPEGGFAFGSEIKALLEIDRPEMDTTALRDFFSYKYVPHPKTIYQGIRRLPPAHTLSWADGRLEIRRYWEPSAETRITDMGEATERLGELLEQIVPEHTLSDVPVGLFLSGGIDSTTLAAHLDHPRTFTLAVESARFNEAPAAQLVAAYYGTEHVEEPAAAIDLAEAITAIPRIYDEPFGDSAAWSSWLVSRMAARHVKVALTGEGGDELFLGYRYYDKFPTYRSTALRRGLAGLVSPFSRTGRSLGRRAATGLERYAVFLPAFTMRQKQALLSPDLMAPDYDDLWHVRRFWREELDPLKRLQWADLHAHLPGGLLTKVDRASMAHSLEARPPLLDHRLVEFALSLDTGLLRDPEAGQGKLVVRRLMKPRVPAGLFDRPKKGFGLPIREWVGREPELLQGAFDSLTTAGVLRGGSMPRLDNDQAWSLLVLDQWMKDTGFAP